MAENITNVKLMYIPLDNEYKHTLYFATLTEQLNYFKNVSASRTFSDFSYQPKESRLRVALSLDDAMKFNYVMYQNSNYNNKYFFAFITNYEWNNEDLTTLTLETDVLQTWMHDITIHPSFIDREHTKDDGIGKNTIPENLEMGEYYCRSKRVDMNLNDYSIIICVSETPDGSNWSTIYDGIHSGLVYYAFPYAEGEGVTKKIIDFTSSYTKNGKADAIKCMFLYPSQLIEIDDMEGKYPNRVKSGWNIKGYTIEIPKSDAFVEKEETQQMYKGYTPKNNKLFTYPYMYLMLSNNNGVACVYQYEHFPDSICKFKVEACITPGGSIRLIPQNYKNNTNAFDEGINLGKFAICNWSSDEYTNWLTQNSVNIALNMVSGIGQIVGGVVGAVATGGVGAVMGGGMVASGVSTIAGQLAQIHQMSFTPDQVRGNVNAGDVITASKMNKFIFSAMSIKPEYMKVIDEYFSAYGYKCNRIKVPEKNHRENWWFTKTVDVNISGQIPIVDLSKIKACYNNGITFWRSANNIKNYNLTNNIV